jgi:hypothetical protein
MISEGDDFGGAELKGGVDRTHVQRIKFQVPVSFPAARNNALEPSQRVWSTQETAKTRKSAPAHAADDANRLCRKDIIAPST